MTKLLLNLSNVSTRFRYELAQVFWKKTYVYCEAHVHGYELLHFLYDRPSIYKGIKSLRIEMNMRGRNIPYGATSANFKEFCEVVSTTLKLDEFEMRISFWDDELEELATTGKGILAFLKASRILNVSGTFKLIIEPSLSGSSDMDKEEIEEAETRWRELWFSMIEQRLMPRSLRPSAM